MSLLCLLSVFAKSNTLDFSDPEKMTELAKLASRCLPGSGFPETLGLLGSNLDIVDPVAVCKANEMCNNLGLDTISTGGMAGNEGHVLRASGLES